MPTRWPSRRSSSPRAAALRLVRLGLTDAVLFGHGHWDHIADAPEVARQTHAKLYGGPPTTEWLKAQGVPDAQLVTWKGGEKQAFKFSGLGGSRMGTPSIFRFVRAQAQLRNTGSSWNPWWYPRPEGTAP